MGMIVASPLAMLLLSPDEYAHYWLVWPGAALMLGALLARLAKMQSCSLSGI